MCRGLRGEVERKLRGVEDLQMAEQVEMAEVEDLQMAEVEMGKRKRWENEAMRGERRRKGIAAGRQKAPLLRSLDIYWQEILGTCWHSFLGGRGLH